MTGDRAEGFTGFYKALAFALREMETHWRNLDRGLPWLNLYFKKLLCCVENRQKEAKWEAVSQVKRLFHWSRLKVIGEERIYFTDRNTAIGWWVGGRVWEKEKNQDDSKDFARAVGRTELKYSKRWLSVEWTGLRNGGNKKFKVGTLNLGIPVRQLNRSVIS